MAIDRKELEGSGKLTFDEKGGLVGERIFEVAWDDADDFLDELRGALGAVISTRPATFSATRDYLYCVHAELEGTGKTLGTADEIAYSVARVTARYEARDYDSSRAGSPQDRGVGGGMYRRHRC